MKREEWWMMLVLVTACVPPSHPMITGSFTNEGTYIGGYSETTQEVNQEETDPDAGSSEGGTYEGGSSTDHMETTNGCASRDARYSVHFDDIQGNCGLNFLTRTFMIPTDGKLNMGTCRPGPDHHADGCTDHVDMVCDVNTDGQTFRMTQFGTMIWAEDGDMACGGVFITLTGVNGTQYCQAEVKQRYLREDE